MEKKVKFIIETTNYQVPWEVQHSLDRLRIKLKKYICDKFNYTLYYEMNIDNSLYSDVLKLMELYGNELSLQVQYKVEYSEEELNEAVAFIPKFTKIQLEEYGDDNLTHIEICEKCGVSKFAEKYIANPAGKANKLNTGDYVIKCGDQIDEVYGISKYMFDNMSNDFLKIGFKPIFAKRGKEPFGYGFYGKEEVELYNDNYIYEEQCDECNSILAEEKSKIEGPCEFYVKEKLDFTNSPVYVSRQFYDKNQIVFIKPELYKYIIDKVKNAEFIPVFLNNH
ncbi:MAG: hypothetical protein E7254_06190 [Lachnospiraceae bacterium]|nr:hypothetical protein [Lachnospiraceae bacterium]